MPAAHIKSKYCFAVASLSGVNRLGDVLIGGPEVLMKHSTPWRDVLDPKEASVIAGNLWRRRVNGEACTTLTPEISLTAGEKCVQIPE